MNQNPYQSPQANINTQSLYESEPNDSKWYSFSGRIGRLRLLSYPMLMVILFYFVIGIAFGVAAATGSETVMVVAFIIAFISAIPLFIYMVVYPVRRLHDLGKTGWLVLIYLIPIVGLFFYLYLLFAPGNEGDNEFGAPPRPNKWYHWIGALLLPLFFILGMLASISLPAYQDYIERAATAQIEASE